MPKVPPYFQVALPMSPANPTATQPSSSDTTPSASNNATNHSTSNNTTPSSTHPTPTNPFPLPTLRLHLNTLSDEGTSLFLTNTHGSKDLSTQIQNVLRLLYSTPSDPTSAPPPTRSVTLILHPFPGVAYTLGTDLDADHKEIHLSTTYISQTASNKTASQTRHEILGVLCHELVHCFQHTSESTAPGGMIEGMADWVRLNAGLGAAHWQQEAEGEWDQGYQHTAFFLEYLEERFGEGTVRGMNAVMKEGEWSEERVFGGCCRGEKVGKLWGEYKESLKRGKGGKTEDGNEGKTIPTHAPKMVP